MAAYRIIMTPDAADDLADLGDYIANVLYARDTALSYVRAIRKEIAALAEMPAVYKVMDDEPWHSRGLRRFLVKNFYVYYRDKTAPDSHRLVIYRDLHAQKRTIHAPLTNTVFNYSFWEPMPHLRYKKKKQMLCTCFCVR